MSKKHFPMWGGNNWTKSMYTKKYWFVIVVIRIGCVIVIIEINK